MRAIGIENGAASPRESDVPRLESPSGRAVVRRSLVGVDGIDHAAIAGHCGGLLADEEYPVPDREAVDAVEETNPPDIVGLTSSTSAFDTDHRTTETAVEMDAL